MEHSSPESVPVRTLFQILAAALTFLLGGWTLLNTGHIYTGLGLMALATLYLAIELFTSKGAARVAPGMLRFVAAVVVLCVVCGISIPRIQELRQQKSFAHTAPASETVKVTLAPTSPVVLPNSPAKRTDRQAVEQQKSQLEITKAIGVQAKNTNDGRLGFFLNVFYENKGTIPAKTMSHRAITVFTDGTDLMPDQQEADYKALAQKAPLPDKSTDIWIYPGSPPEHYFSVPAKDDEIARGGPLAADVVANKRRLYLFLVMKYTDDSLPNNQIRVTEFCGWFMGSLEVWHACGNRIYTTKRIVSR